MLKILTINLALWFLLGALLLNIVVFLVYKTSIVDTAREKDGTLKKKQGLKGLGALSGMLMLILLFMLGFDFTSFQRIESLHFSDILIANAILILLLVFYDSFFIDLFVLGRWKPRILDIPEELTMKSMKYHVKKQFTLGWLIVIPVILISSLLFYLLIRQ
jgi:hypothetical protein